jgi:hypothetical protein
MSDRIRNSMTNSIHALPIAVLVLVLLATVGTAWCQAGEPTNADKVETKEAAKSGKEIVKEAEKAIKAGNIDQLKAILESNSEVVSSPTPQSKSAAVAATVLFGPALAAMAQSNVTLLHDAVSRNRKDMVELLLTYHANINARNGFGYTPLHQAIMNQNTEMVQLLLDNGADVHIKAKNGDTPLKLLRWEKNTRTRKQPLQPFLDIEKLLIAHGA